MFCHESVSGEFAPKHHDYSTTSIYRFNKIRNDTVKKGIFISISLVNRELIVHSLFV